MKTLFYINKYIEDGFCQSETFYDRADAIIASNKGDKKFGLPYAKTMIFNKISNDVNKFVSEVVF